MTKASLLFARRVALVEGTSEQLLLSALAEKLGRPLSDAGVAVINVGGVSFGPFVKLFGPEKLPYRCAIISDSDPPETEDDMQGRTAEDPALSATARRLLDRQSDNVRVFLSRKTLEWDLVASGNWEIALAGLKRIRPVVAARLEDEHADSAPEARADALLAAVKEHKGRFAQALIRELRDREDLVIPGYLTEAIEWLTEEGGSVGAESSETQPQATAPGATGDVAQETPADGEQQS